MGDSIWKSMEKKGYSRREFHAVLRGSRNRGGAGTDQG